MNNKMFCSLFCVLWLMAGLAGCRADTANLLPNADREEGSILPSAWKTWSFQIDKSSFSSGEGGAQSGQRYAVIHSPQANAARFNQIIKVTQDAFYKVSGWIRTKDVPEIGKGANINLGGVHMSAKGFFGTNDVNSVLSALIRLLTGYKRGDFVMLGVTGFSILCALLMLFWKKPPPG